MAYPGATRGVPEGDPLDEGGVGGLHGQAPQGAEGGVEEVGPQGRVLARPHAQALRPAPPLLAVLRHLPQKGRGGGREGGWERGGGKRRAPKTLYIRIGWLPATEEPRGRESAVRALTGSIMRPQSRGSHGQIVRHTPLTESSIAKMICTSAAYASSLLTGAQDRALSAATLR